MVDVYTFLLLVALFFLVFALIKSSDQVVVALRRLSRETHTKTFVLSAILLAVATSFPELFVGITSALNKTSTLSFGNILGANIANVSLVAGIAALVAGRVHISKEYIKKEVLMAAVAGILPLLLIYDKSLSRLDGGILLLAYIAYATSFYKERFLQISHHHRKEGYIHRFLRNFEHPVEEVIHHPKEWFRFFLSIGVMLLSASLIVKVATTLAVAISVPVFLIGLVLLSVGTTLPELVFSIRSLGEHAPTMFFGNLLGSIIANSTLILGLVALISPVQINGVSEYMIAVTTFLVVFGVFWFFIRSKPTLERWEAAILLIIYLTFVFVEFV